MNENDDQHPFPGAEDGPTRSGFVAIVGRPNVGKSTLLNAILGQKISITSPRPQTTRQRILGIKTVPGAQAIYVDTPGVHKGAKRAINKYMNRAALSALGDVDLVVFVVEGTRWTDEDALVLERIKESGHPTILVVNKVDKVKDKRDLLPHIKALSEKHDFIEVIPMAAIRGEVAPLEAAVFRNLPEGPFMFPPDQITDKSERFLAAELIREKLMRHLGKEVPYRIAVEIERFHEREDGLLEIDAVIWVERPGQKAIVIGKGGRQLKVIGTEARQDMERLFGHKVFLQLWVRVREGWSDDLRALRSLGYRDDD